MALHRRELVRYQQDMGQPMGGNLEAKRRGRTGDLFICYLLRVLLGVSALRHGGDQQMNTIDAQYGDLAASRQAGFAAHRPTGVAYLDPAMTIDHGLQQGGRLAN